jgi:hypothetical protein
MKEVEVGLRVDPVKGLMFFGLEEVNELLLKGANVTSLEPVGALTRQVQQEDRGGQFTISGFSIKVKLVELNT